MRTTFGRTITVATAVLLVILLVLGAALQFLVRDYLEQDNFNTLSQDAAAISTLASAYYAEGSLSAGGFMVNLSVASSVSGADAYIISDSGKVILCSADPFGCSHLGLVIDSDYQQRVYAAGSLAGRGTIPQLYSGERYVVSQTITDEETGKPIGLVLVCKPTGAVTAVLRQFTDMVMVVSLLIVIAGILIAVLFAHRHAKPLREMARVAGVFGHGDLTARVSVSPNVPEEVEELALAFNNMASSLQKSEYARQEFVANVSHELKTPMTTIAGYVDGILDGTIPQSKERYYLSIVSDEIGRLSRLVRSMLDISQLQDEQIPDSKKSVFDVSESAGRVLLTFEQKINAKNLDVDVSFPEHPVTIRAYCDSITQVIYNLLDNAIKFSPNGGKLELKIVEGGGKAYISVANQGQTIPAEELPLVFDRFHKLDKSRSMNRDGYGLGLYIVKTIVCSHGEDISVTSRDGRTEFTFTMPLSSNLYLEAE